MGGGEDVERLARSLGEVQAEAEPVVETVASAPHGFEVGDRAA